MKRLLLISALLLCAYRFYHPDQVRFGTTDGLTVTADQYDLTYLAPWIIAFHEDGCSRGEYRETSQWLLSKGFNVLAVDVRAGDKINGVKNITAERAVDLGLPNGHMDAMKDVQAAIRYIWNKTHKPVILLGSSFTASLALMQAKDNPYVKAVAAFSPDQQLDDVWLADQISGLDKPVFVTGSSHELSDAKAVTSGLDPDLVTVFEPHGTGVSGSRALWSSSDGNILLRNAFYKWLKPYR